MAEIIKQIKHKKPNLKFFPLVFILVLVLVSWGVNKIKFSDKHFGSSKTVSRQILGPNALGGCGCGGSCGGGGSCGSSCAGGCSCDGGCACAGPGPLTCWES